MKQEELFQAHGQKVVEAFLLELSEDIPKLIVDWMLHLSAQAGRRESETPAEHLMILGKILQNPSFRSFGDSQTKSTQDRKPLKTMVLSPNPSQDLFFLNRTSEPTQLKLTAIMTLPQPITNQQQTTVKPVEQTTPPSKTTIFTTNIHPFSIFEPLETVIFSGFSLFSPVVPGFFRRFFSRFGPHRFHSQAPIRGAVRGSTIREAIASEGRLKKFLFSAQLET